MYIKCIDKINLPLEHSEQDFNSAIKDMVQIFI